MPPTWSTLIPESSTLRAESLRRELPSFGLALLGVERVVGSDGPPHGHPVTWRG